MSFVQVEFLAMFLGTWVVYWRLPRVLQNLLLLGVGAVFYGWVHPWFLIPLAASSAVDFAAARAMTTWPARRGAWLALSMTVNLGMLGWFKYAGWFVDNVNEVLGHLGLGGLGSLSVLLPVGISFYTFQTMSYVIDVYRGRVEARRNPLDFFLFVSFFPQLVAGPIERASRLLPQVEAVRSFRWNDQRAGLTLALWGACKKVAIADSLAPWVDRVHAHPDPSFEMIAAATVAFSVQLLADFSGYTDIARGSARMLGFHLSENFRYPYLAATPMEAWSRFHISLTSWFTDYVYYPLAQSRWIRAFRLPGTQVGGAGLVARVTLITFVVSGLWHGAAWHFALWGLYLGLLQVAYIAVQRRLPAGLRADARWRVLAVPLMFGFQLVALLLFRTPTFERIVHHITQVPGTQTASEATVAAATLGMALVFATPLVVVMLWEIHLLPWARQRVWFPVAQSSAWGLCVCALLWFARPTATDFVYFGF